MEADSDGGENGHGAGALPPLPMVALPSKMDEERQKNLQDALLLQMDLQKRLHEQLESQRQLQLHLEAHGRYITRLMERDRAESSEQGGGYELPKGVDLDLLHGGSSGDASLPVNIPNSASAHSSGTQVPVA